MTLILRKSGQVSERTRWNLSFSGLSLSHKRGWLTLNTRRKSVINFPGTPFSFKVGPAGTLMWFIFFLITDFLILLGKILCAPPAFVIDGTHELLIEKPEDREPKLGLAMLVGGVLGVALEIFVIFKYVVPLFS